MADVVGTGEVVIVPNAAGFGAKLNTQVDSSIKGLNSPTGPLGKLNGLFEKFGVNSTLAFAAAGAAAVGFAKASVDAYKDHQVALQELTTSLQNAPQIIDKTTTSFEEQATALQNLTGFQDEEVLRADAVLARFGATRDQIAQLNPLVADYARTTGQDMTTAAGNLGRALLGNARALKAVGINFTATGNRAEDLATITALLQDKVGGAAEAFGDTFAGKVEILNAKLDDLKETIGQALIPTLSQAADSLGNLISGFDSLLKIIPGGGLGGIFGKIFNASPVGIFGDAVGAVADLFHGHFLDAAKGAANALIPFWDPFTKDTAEATTQMQAASRTMTLVGSNADAYASHISGAAQATSKLNTETQEMRTRVLAMVDPSHKARDAISGIEVKLYDADAAMRAFLHSIDIYLGKIGQVGGRRGTIVPGTGGVGKFASGVDATFTQPTLALFAESGPEHVKITPLGGSGTAPSGRLGGDVHLHFHAPVYGLRSFYDEVEKGVAQVFARANR